MHFTAFDLWVNNLRIKRKKRGSGCMCSLYSTQEVKGRSQSVEIDKDREYRRQTLTRLFHSEICHPDLTVGDRARLALAAFTAVAMLHTVCLIIYPIIFQTLSPSSVC